MTLSLTLNPGLQQGILNTAQQQVRAIANAARPAAISSADQFVFFAAFDGTNNELETVGHAQNTNVAQLFLQAHAVAEATPNLQASYYPGPGTKGTLRKSDWLNDRVTKQVKVAAKNAYDDFARQRLLPRKLSQLGPGISWIDLDGDGRDDLESQIPRELWHHL